MKEYQQLLNYFDAFKIGLTATPVKRATDFFNDPIYHYTFREAVADGHLIDYEPLITYKTKLTEQPFCFSQESTIKVINTLTGDIEAVKLQEDLIVDPNTLNRAIINKHFNEVICQQLIHELTPFSEEKTLIFCASDLHADMVKNLLDKTFNTLYGDSYDQSAVAKITVHSYNPEKLITNFKTQQYPSIAITVDLLATAVNVPQVCNLVFLRSIKSRILLEQMLARASQPCEQIKKTSFRIYDIFATHHLLPKITSMQPMPQSELPLTYLLKAFVEDRQPTPEKLKQILGYCNPLLRRANYQAIQDRTIQTKLEALTSSWGIAPKHLIIYLRGLGTKKAADFFKNHKNFVNDIQEINQLLDLSRYQIISDEPDQFTQRILCYGDYTNPSDFLIAFNNFIKEHEGQNKLLNKIVERPNHITNAELKAIKLLLDKANFTETHLYIARRNYYHQVIDAGLIGFIRHVILNEPLVPFEDRVEQTLQVVQTMAEWTPLQRQWLNRMAVHFIRQEVLEKKQLNSELKQHYGSSIEKLDTLLNNQLNDVIKNFRKLWPEDNLTPLKNELAVSTQLVESEIMLLKKAPKKTVFQRIKCLLKFNV